MFGLAIKFDGVKSTLDPFAFFNNFSTLLLFSLNKNLCYFFILSDRYMKQMVLKTFYVCLKRF